MARVSHVSSSASRFHQAGVSAGASHPPPSRKTRCSCLFYSLYSSPTPLLPCTQTRAELAAHRQQREEQQREFDRRRALLEKELAEKRAIFEEKQKKRREIEEAEEKERQRIEEAKREERRNYELQNKQKLEEYHDRLDLTLYISFLHLSL